MEAFTLQFSVHRLLEKESIYLQFQDSYWNDLQNKAYEYLLFSPAKYTEHILSEKMKLHL